MPLPPPAEREHLHTRRYDFQGYRRADGLWDIEGRMTDTKSYAFTNRYRGEIRPGEPIHDMAVRLTIDEDFVVREAVAVTDAGPFAECPAIAANYRKLVGKRLAGGWRRQVRELFAGTEGCTHLSELLGGMATVAFQALYPALKAKGRTEPARGRPPLIDSCYAFRSDGPVVEQTWPGYYTGD